MLSHIFVGYWLYDIFSFLEGNPIYMSWPHFLHGENILLNGVDGLAPNPENHSFILDVDPVSIRITFYEHILTPDFPNVSSVLSPIKRNGFWKRICLWSSFVVLTLIICTRTFWIRSLEQLHPLSTRKLIVLINKKRVIIMSRLSGPEYVTLYNWMLRKHSFNIRIHIAYSLNL